MNYNIHMVFPYFSSIGIAYSSIVSVTIMVVNQLIVNIPVWYAIYQTYYIGLISTLYSMFHKKKPLRIFRTY